MQIHHSTRFILNWVLIGLTLGGLLIAFSVMDFSPPLSPESVVSQKRDSYADAVDKAAPSVVSITAFYNSAKSNTLLPFTPSLKLPPGKPPQYKIRPNKGSGVIISTAGYIVTNHHVVADANRIEVTLHNGRKLDAKILGLDADSDLAVIVTKLNSLPALTIADSSQIHT
ncbi:HtrA protease/chaperone protein, partial [hydrothermal vent metagenome]